MALKQKIRSRDDFLALLKGVKLLKGGEYLALCPAHKDTKPSLSVREEWGTLLVKCHAGCLIETILEKLGLSMSDLYLNGGSKVITKKPIAIYNYDDENGKLLYQVLRYKPRDFCVRHPDNEGTWQYDLKGVRKVLYRLPSVIEGVKTEKPIYITEGEKDADRIESLGLVATCNPFGAGKGKWKPEYTGSLAGAREVIILPDNDTEGMNHAEEIASQLYGKVKSLKALLLPNLPPKGDVSDWLDKGGTVEALETLMKDTPEYTPPPRVYKDIIDLYATEKRNLASKRDNIKTTSGQDWGFYAEKFDEVMRNSEGRQDKREVAETIGLRVASDTFRKLLQRRKNEGKVRAYRGSHYLIEWINRDYAITQLDKAETSPMLDLKFALRIHEYASVPPGSVVGFAGMVSGGKTSALLETAELNVFTQPKPVYYWYNEMSEGKLIYRCEDFPHLSQAQKEGKFFPVKQGNFEFADVLQPDAINLIDYIDRDDDVFLIGRDIKELYQQLNTGVIIFALQKKPHLDFGYGGYMSVKLSNLYITLEKRYESGKSMHGVAKIVKCKDWANNEVNPCNLQCEYHSGGLHGKLFVDGEWKRTK